MTMVGDGRPGNLVGTGNTGCTVGVVRCDGVGIGGGARVEDGATVPSGLGWVLVPALAFGVSGPPGVGALLADGVAGSAVGTGWRQATIVIPASSMLAASVAIARTIRLDRGVIAVRV